MNQQQFKTLEQSFYDRGYKKYLQHWHHEDFVIGKSFHKNDNEWEENNAAYQILLSIYDWSFYKNYSFYKDYYNRIPNSVRDTVGIEITVSFSRIDERLDISTSWKDTTTIEEVEKFAESFYE